MKKGGLVILAFLLLSIGANAKQDICVDTDGANYYLKSFTSQGADIRWDSCAGESSVLKEQDCNNGGNQGEDNYNCPQGCFDGACRDVIETDSASGTTDYGSFERTQDVYIKGRGWACTSGLVNIYIVEDRDKKEWKDDPSAGAFQKSIEDVAVTAGEFTATWYHTDPKYTENSYDVLVECKENSDKEYDPADGDAVDGLNVIGFQVLPEALTGLLLISGLASMAVYAGIKR